MCRQYDSYSVGSLYSEQLLLQNLVTDKWKHKSSAVALL